MSEEIKKDEKQPSKIKRFFNWLKDVIKKIGRFIIVPPNSKESAFQWIYRQFLIPDSDGNPSSTMTLAAVVIVYSGIAIMSNIQIATSYITTYSETGAVLSKKMVGFTSEFWYFMITFAGAAIYVFRQRQKELGKKDSTEEENPNNPINNIIESASNMIDKIKGK